jgi:hypothetical protein
MGKRTDTREKRAGKECDQSRWEAGDKGEKLVTLEISEIMVYYQMKNIQGDGYAKLI